MLSEVQYVALGLAVLLTSTSAQLGLNEEREDLLRNVDCNVDCQHKSRNPVCGTNGRTYESRCDLERDICKKVKVQLKHDGECSLTEKCMDERRAKQEQVNRGEMVYVPTCEQDGSYSPVQCHNFTFYCWCSLEDGNPIPETFTKDEIPKCLGEHPVAATKPPSEGKWSVAAEQGVHAFETLLSLSTALPNFLPPRNGPSASSLRRVCRPLPLVLNNTHHHQHFLFF